MKPKKEDDQMKIRSQHNFTISISDMTKLLAPRVIELIGDEGLSEDLVSISWNKKTQKFQVSVDVTWEPDLNDLDDDNDEEENEIAQVLSEYQFSYELKEGSRLTNSIWKEMKAEIPYTGETMCLIRRDGKIIKAEVNKIGPYGDLRVFLDGEDLIVTNFNEADCFSDYISEIKMICWG
jgi:hypothetical protein